MADWAGIANRTKRLLRSVWLFPGLAVTALVLLTSLQVSGSSVGVYSMLNGTFSQDSNAVAGQPRGVRSDEWLVTTQMTVAQANNSFEKVNKNVGEGQNMSLLDVPASDWSTLFKPQNIMFLILPLEFAFAFKWWLMLVILLLAVYFFMLELFPKKYIWAALVSVFTAFTPMIFWWYASGTILCIAYTFLAMLFVMRLLGSDTKKHRIIYTAALAYTLVCFGLLLYPPFQIPCIIVGAAFLTGWIISRYDSKPKLRNLLTLWPYFTAAAVIPLMIGLAFVYDNREVIKDTTNTVYPGTRVIPSGGTDPLLALSSFLSPNLQYDEKAAYGYLRNQSEASTFIFIAPFLFLPSLYLIVRERRRNKKTLWALLLVNLLLAAFLARMYLSTPWLEPIYKIFLLDKVPNTRLLIGIGLAGILQLILLIKALEKTQLKKVELWTLSLAGGLSCLVTLLLVGNYTIDHFPTFITSFAKVAVFALWISGSIFLLLQKRFTLALAALAVFTLFSVYRIHPLYRGLDPIADSKLTNTIKSYPEDGSWVVLEDRLLINFPLMAGKDSLNSVQFAPQLDLWDDIDKKGQYENVYNRYAHVVFTTKQEMHDPLELEHADMFYVRFDSCDGFIQKHAKYVLATDEVNQACLRHSRTISEPARKFHIYEVVRPNTQ